MPNRRPARSSARPQVEVENRRREAELEIKEMALQQQAESEKELRRLRGELHERERLLDKRQDALEEQAEVLRKQEKMVESTQRKLTERIQDANRRKEELSKLLDLQRQTLHELSGLSHEEATRRLLEILDGQLQKETGAVILAHEKRLAETCEEKTRDDIADLDPALRRRPHGRNHHQHRGHSQRRDEGANHRPRGARISAPSRRPPAWTSSSTTRPAW